MGGQSVKEKSHITLQDGFDWQQNWLTAHLIPGEPSCYDKLWTYHHKAMFFIALFSAQAFPTSQFLTTCEVGKPGEQGSQTWAWAGAVAVGGGVAWIIHSSQGQFNGATCVVYQLDVHVHKSKWFYTKREQLLYNTYYTQRICSYVLIHKKQPWCLPAASRMPNSFTHVCSYLEIERRD